MSGPGEELLQYAVHAEDDAIFGEWSLESLPSEREAALVLTQWLKPAGPDVAQRQWYIAEMVEAIQTIVPPWPTPLDARCYLSPTDVRLTHGEHWGVYLLSSLLPSSKILLSYPATCPTFNERNGPPTSLSKGLNLVLWPRVHTPAFANR
jgi:hypothetical protein